MIEKEIIASIVSSGLVPPNIKISDYPKLILQSKKSNNSEAGDGTGTDSGSDNIISDVNGFRTYYDSSSKMGYIYYYDDVIASFDMSGNNIKYDPFDFVSGRRVIYMPLIAKVPLFSSTSAGVTMEYASLTNNLFVDEDGFVTALKKGIGCIVTKVTYKEKIYVNTCLVYAGYSNPNSNLNSITSKRSSEPTNIFFINYPKDNKMKVGDYHAITAYIYPNDIRVDDNLNYIVSDNENVVQCDCGILKAVGVGKATLTAYAIGYEDITSSIEITVEDVEEHNNIYNVVKSEIDVSDPILTAKSISLLIKKASDNGYNYIKFPYDVYHIKSDDTVNGNKSVIIDITSSNITVDFQGSELIIHSSAMSYSKDSNAYTQPSGVYAIRFEGCKNSHFINAKIHGDRYEEHDDGKTMAWYCMLVHTTFSENCSVENCDIYDGISWGVGTMTRNYKSYPIWSDMLKLGGYNNDGTYNDSLYGFCTNITSFNYGSGRWIDDYYFINKDNTMYQVGSDIWANGDYPFCSSRIYNIFWYDSNKNLIKACLNKHQHYLYYDRPENAEYFAIHFVNPLSDGIPKGGNAQGVYEDGTRSYVAAINTGEKPVGFKVKNCNIYHNGTMGGACCGGWNIQYIGCKFWDNGGGAVSDNPWSFDIEDGGSNTNISFIECEFDKTTSVDLGFVTAMPSTDLIILNCKFNNQAQLRANNSYPRIISNTFYVTEPQSMALQTDGCFCYNNYNKKTILKNFPTSRLHNDAVYTYNSIENYNAV